MSAKPEEVRVVLRYDDCSARSSLQLEENFISALADLGMRCSLGVTPFICEGDFHDPTFQRKLSLAQEKARMLQGAAKDGHIEIALHGYYHQMWKTDSNGEFGGLAAAEQGRRISDGRGELESRLGIQVNSFIPPWNGYDETTMRILKAEGFGCLSGSLRGPFLDTPDRWFLPYSVWFRGLREVIPSALKLSRFRPVLVVMFHDFDFYESGHPDAYMTVDDCKKELEWLSEVPGVVTLSLGQATEQGAALNGTQLRFHQAWRAGFRRFPYRYRVLLEDQVFYPGANRAINFQNLVFQTFISTSRLRRDLTSAALRKLRRLSAPSP